MSDKDTQDEIQVVILRLQQEEFGVEIKSVREIVPMINITRLPSAADNMVVGVINLRGQVIPVINLAKLLDLPKLAVLPKTARIVVTEINKMVVGMIVDEVPHVLKIAEQDIQPAPEIIQQKISSDFIQGVGKLEDRLIIMLDIAKLLQPHTETMHVLKEVNNE